MLMSDDTISTLAEDDYGEIDSNLNQVATLLLEAYNKLVKHLNNIDDMESKFVKKKLEDDIQIILSNLEEIMEYSDSLLESYSSYYDAMEEADKKIK